MKESSVTVQDSTSMAVSEWRSRLSALTAAVLLFEALTGFGIYLLPFGRGTQFSVLLHTLGGIVLLGPPSSVAPATSNTSTGKSTTDIGKVQRQNQYDSWKNSRWF